MDTAQRQFVIKTRIDALVHAGNAKEAEQEALLLVAEESSVRMKAIEWLAAADG